MTTRRQRLAARRKSLGFSQEALAERLEVDPKTIRRWENGTSEPQPWLWPKLARHLQVSSEQLELLLGEAAAADDVDERVDFARTRSGSVDLMTAARLRSQVQALDERYDREPSSSLLADAGHCLGQIMLLRAKAAGSRVRRELLAAEAESATLMGQLVWDASQRRDNASAHRYFDQAVTAAQQAHDPVTESFALLRKSFVALYGEQDAVRGLALCERTARSAAGASDVLTGLATLHAAEAHAMLGGQNACERALGAANTHLERANDADAAIELFSPTQSGRLAGSCYLFLSQPKRALSVLEATAAQMRARSKSQAIVLGNLGLGYIRQGEVDSAAAMLHQAIDVIEETRGGGGLNVVFGACRELQPWRGQVVVQDVYDRAFSLMTIQPAGYN
ncbi:helix-turn-helix transcriptional regulator [Actinokineospora sp. 24-640]